MSNPYELDAAMDDLRALLKKAQRASIVTGQPVAPFYQIAVDAVTTATADISTRL